MKIIKYFVSVFLIVCDSRLKHDSVRSLCYSDSFDNDDGLSWKGEQARGLASSKHLRHIVVLNVLHYV